MPLLIKEIRDNSVLKSHGVQAGDYLAHMNAWSVRSLSNVQTAFRSNQLDLQLRRDKESFEIKVETNDLGIVVEDENGETFEVKRIEGTGGESDRASSPQAYRSSEGTTNSYPASLSILKITTWGLLLINLIFCVYLMANNLLIEVPNRFGRTTEVINIPVLSIIIISMVSSGLLVTLAHVLDHLAEEARATREELRAIAKRIASVVSAE